MRDCLAAFLTFLASEPRFADMCIVEVLAAGPEAVERRNGVMRAMAGLIQAAAAELKEGQKPPPLTAETIVGGIYEVVYSRVLQGKTAGAAAGASARSRLLDDAPVHRARRGQARGREGSEREDARTRGRLSAARWEQICVWATGSCGAAELPRM